MAIKFIREITCEKHGKKFVVKCNDDITIEELKILINKLCLNCRIIKRIRGR